MVGRTKGIRPAGYSVRSGTQYPHYGTESYKNMPFFDLFGASEISFDVLPHVLIRRASTNYLEAPSFVHFSACRFMVS
jgi:hypothetical protein